MDLTIISIYKMDNSAHCISNMVRWESDGVPRTDGHNLATAAIVNVHK